MHDNTGTIVVQQAQLLLDKLNQTISTDNNVEYHGK
jgi:hypothetical protein